jgi:hypothetical protein
MMIRYFKEVNKSMKEKFLSKEQYLDWLKNNPNLFFWKTYEDYKKNSKDGVPLVDILRKDILETKKILKNDYKQRGMVAYNEMLAVCLENPAAVFRARMIPGTKKIQSFLNFVIMLSKILFLIAIILLSVFIFSKFNYKAMGIFGVIILFFNYLMAGYLQTEINFELAARLVTLDKKMNLKEVI